ncbi:alpha-ketoglutarate-dependent dioxygenase AlkB [Aquimarina sediminis]|uniref:alpha-ketoglutarate-dependent dioxygenase AlkB n=1 Tax=Aquimarina sediminis TaxID=2070536 RepID=UPI000CA069EA|nr:alpha-ketoglutarate-dependent dioxygenase AlkB [Aquimarina sediminis]
MKLPLHCSVDYIHDFLSKKEAEELYHVLINECRIDKSQLTIRAGGKTITTDSFKILFSTESLIQQNSHPEHIHGKVFVWSGLMAKLKERIERLTTLEFDIAMCLYYPNGNYYAPYHNDQQTSGHKTILPSISLGEVREFSFKENLNQNIYTLDLENGSLLIMGEYCQSRYTHSLLKNPKYKNGRINITFRESGFK